MISKSLAKIVINEALSTGADYAEIFLEDSYARSISLENGKVETTSSNSTTGCGLRLLKENRSVYGYTTDLSKKGLLKLANTLNKSFNGERILSVDGFTKVKAKNRNPIGRPYGDVSREEIISLLRLGDDEIIGLHNPKIVRHNSIFAYNHRGVTLFNSKGKFFHSDNEFGRIIFSVIAADETGFETGFNGPGTQKDISFFYNELDVKEVARDAARVALQNLGAKECPSGVMPVVIGNGWGGVLFHEACGHPLEASAAFLGLSCFSGKNGEYIASKVVSAVDDSTIPGAWGSIDIDDEGNPGEKRQLIKDGILVGNLIDDFNGRRMNMPGNGASRRQNYKFCPTSRMSNTYIENGKSTKEEIIAATKLGLYAVGFNGGSVNPATGEFNFGCSEAYIIRDGKICEPVKGATLIGKGHEMLHHIDMVANDLDLGTGMCGAASGSIKVTVGQPTLRVSEVYVGGRGGELK